MSEYKTEIIKIKDLLLKDNLVIPEYQRPYKWTTKNVNQLIDDILFFNDKEAYRLGTVVLHKDGETLNIVDGQQRTISLYLIYLALGDVSKKVVEFENKKVQINWKFSNQISQYNIQNNYQAIKQRINEFDEKTINFLFEKCEVVVITLSVLTEAFQFFDSQNARGKELEPHDLLKAYHLRKMSNAPEKEKAEIVHAWEEIDTAELSSLFSNYLFRIRNWSKGRSARYFTKKEIDIFKGIDLHEETIYSYAKIYAIANYYVDDHNIQYHRQIDKHKMDYPFGFDQPIINGKRFFEMVGYYQDRLENLKNLCENEIIKLIDTYDSKSRTGDRYVRNLFDCALLFYIDKFGEVEIDKAIEKLFIWAYTLRLRQHSVQIASLDNYAFEETKLFSVIREATNHKEIVNMSLGFVEEVKATNIDELKKEFEGLGYVKQSAK
jgi:hypothetical protein